MDIINLRLSSARFTEKLKQAPTLRFMDILRNLLLLEGDEFVWELYRQFFFREADPEGFQSHINGLNAGVPKTSFLLYFLQSAEAERLYSPSQSPAKYPHTTFIGSFHRINHVTDVEFVYCLYQDLLLRQPDLPGLHSHIHHLSLGLSRVRLLCSFIESGEFQEKIHAVPPLAAPPLPHAQSYKHIGIFLGYQPKIYLDGEGIGRFVVRLAEGLLLNAPDVMIHVATTEHNFAEVEKLFQAFASLYPNRLFMHHFPSVTWLNQHLPVDVWCVPYVGMDLALQLERPVVLCVHDLVYTHFRELYVRKHPELVQGLDRIVHAMADKADKVVFNSAYVQNYEGLSYLQLPHHKTQVIRLAAPVEEYRNLGLLAEGAFRSKYQLHGDYLVFPSIIRAHKNHDRLLEAFLNYRQSPEGRASKLKLVLTDHYRHRPLEREIAAVLGRCRDSEALNSIVYLTRLPSGDMPSLYKYAAGTIVPTLFEGSCPFPILESLTVDTPVAISRIEVTREVVNDMNAFVTFDPYSVPEMTAAIARLYQNRHSLAAQEKAAIRGTLQRTWSDVAQEYYRLFQSLIHR
ncbi:DUF4214 domain-containing protein [Paenibacillus elgii]|uniref:DUF4214 domain-containing protein n=1 Tax=Paenibacillus elgii TaxID=189691 RepID=UPI0020407351|nr:DUF4214 domain-containing protein [Paenibacillus elgii]MCM3270974.1 DUF4214 domain-containing protein [Paenibacillus elgii]